MKVSCVMPSCRGRDVARVAVDCFLAQTWEDKELIVLDNSDDGSAEAFSSFPLVRVLRVPRRAIGELRNMGAEAAIGEVVACFDDDDWYAPGRIAAQVARLRHTGKQVTGWHAALFYVPGHGGEFFRYRPSPRRAPRPYAMGASLCYWREWWKSHRHPKIDAGEDGAFSDAALRAGELDSCDAGGLAVIRQLDRDEPLRKLLGKHEQWPEARREDFPAEFLEQVLEKQRAAIAAKEN